jgi:hypothetical protein
VLEHREPKEFTLFPGHVLGKHEVAVATCSPNASLLVNLGAISTDGWL